MTKSNSYEECMKIKGAMKNKGISIEDKWIILQKTKINDYIPVEDCHRAFLHFAFKHIPIDDRPKHKYWLECFNFLMDADYNLNNYVYDQTYKPYALFKLCRDKSMPTAYKKLIYEKHRFYLLDMIMNQPGNDLTEGWRATRYLMHFAPYLCNEDKYTIFKEMYYNPTGKKYFIDYIVENKVCGDMDLMWGMFVADKLINEA